MLIPKTSKMRTTKSKSLFLSKSFKILKNAREINNIPNNRNNSIQLEKNSKLSFNNENTKRKMNLTNSIPLTKQKSLINKNELKLPFLYSKDKKKKKEINIPLDEQRIINYQKMKKYRIKLVKASKAKNEVDNVYELFKDNGLQFLFPSKKKNLFQNNLNNINNININNNFLNKNNPNIPQIQNPPKKLRLNLSSEDIKDLKYKLVSPKSDSNNIKEPNKKQNLEENEEIYKPSFQKYMKLQTLASMKFRPILGETSTDLVKFLKKIELIRKEVINNYIDEINNVENRYNIERPMEDFNFKTKMQGLYHQKWKNLFKLKDYQELFCENLKGKISSKNYDIMQRNFRNIFLMCFSSGIPKNDII